MSYRIAAVRTLGVVAIVAMAYLAGTGGATADNAPYSGVTTAIGGQAGLFAVNTAVPVPTVGATPVAVPDAYSVAPGATLIANVLLNDMDADVAQPSGAWNGPDPVTLSPTGVLTYTAPAGSSGSYTFSYVGYNGTLRSSSTTVTITIETTTSGAAVALDGQAIYNAASCAGCHGTDGVGGPKKALAGTTLGNTVFFDIVETGSMSGYKGSLTTAEVQAIADYFVPPPPTTTTTAPASTTTTAPASTTTSTTAGGTTAALPAVYEQSCAICHGSDGSGGASGPSLLNTSNATIVSRLTDPKSSMAGYASGFTTAQIQTIANYFDAPPPTGGGTTPTTTPPTGSTPPSTTPPAEPGTGASVYNAYCARCHAADLTGSPFGPGVVGESRSEIAKVVRNGDGTMPAFNSAALSDTSLAMLTDYMATFGSKNGHDDDDDHGTTTTSAPAAIGSSVYTSYCLACHGADGTGTDLGPDIVGESRGETFDVVRNGDDGMPAFSATMLSDADLQAVADYVAALGGGGDGHGDKKSDDHDDDEKKSKDHDEDDD